MIVVQIESSAASTASVAAAAALQEAEHAFARLRSSPTSAQAGEWRRIVAAAFLDAAQSWESARPGAALAAAYRRTAVRLAPGPRPACTIDRRGGCVMKASSLYRAVVFGLTAIGGSAGR